MDVMALIALILTSLNAAALVVVVFVLLPWLDSFDRSSPAKEPEPAAAPKPVPMFAPIIVVDFTVEQYQAEVARFNKEHATRKIVHVDYDVKPPRFTYEDK